ncbi:MULTISPECIES: DUF1761 family protein [unclassified Aeromicrobium]|uniref:DUF1761 family protein n=1 Tax=unclassified Aeromicrobium TaxID=2633570 RepID=UPI00396AF20A
MFNVLGDISWIGFSIAAIASIVLAGVWFAVVVPRPYALALGRVGEEAPPASAVSAAGPVVCQLVTLLATAVLVEALGVTATGDAVVFGLVVGVGYLTAMAFQIAINPNVPRPVLYGLVNAPYFVGTSVLAAVLLVAVG